MPVLRLVAATKLFWGLAALFLFGLLTSPVTGSGKNIFLSYGNLTDILRQVSITGLAAVGMTMVILIGGIDLSVGSIMAFGTVLVAMLLTLSGWSAAALIGLPAVAVCVFVATAALVLFVAGNLGAPPGAIGRRREVALGPIAGRIAPALAGAVAALVVVAWLAGQVGPKFGVAGVLVVIACVGALVGALNGLIIVYGRLQPFIVTLAMMVGLLGAARLTAGQDSAVIAVYSGSNATIDIDAVRGMLWGVAPIPGLFFLAAVAIVYALLSFTPFGRYVYAIGGNEEAARLSGLPVARVKIMTYAMSGMLSMTAGLLYVSQYRQGKPDAGAGLELDVIAAVVIGGTSLVGGRGSVIGTLVGVFIFGVLSNLLQLHNINSNLQLVMKGFIIITTVLLQERNLADWLRFTGLRAGAADRPGSAAPSGTPEHSVEKTV